MDIQVWSTPERLTTRLFLEGAFVSLTPVIPLKCPFAKYVLELPETLDVMSKLAFVRYTGVPKPNSNKITGSIFPVASYVFTALVRPLAIYKLSITSNS